MTAACEKHGLRISPVPTSNLQVVERLYLFGDGKTYHPLEAPLVGTPASGAWQQDLATVLGVDAEWVSGFLDGFAQEPESSTGLNTYRAISPPSSCELPATRGTCPTDDNRPCSPIFWFQEDEFGLTQRLPPCLVDPAL